MNKEIGIIDILNLWFKWSKYDPNQTSFNLMSVSYDIHRVTKLAEKVLNDFDNTGLISVILLKEEFYKILKDRRIRLYDAIVDYDKLKAEIEMHKYFSSDIVKEAEKSIQYTIARYYKSIVGVDLLSDGANYTFNIAGILNSVLQDIQKLGVDIYKTDGKPIHMQRYMQSIRVFNTLGEAVLTFENAQDGVYLSYINVLSSADSYFALFVKSGGTLVSFHDRINEMYPGQHEVLNKRNGRWASDKRDGIFPYDCILEYGDYCPKGCAMSFKIKGDSTKGNIMFKDFQNEQGFFGLVLGILLMKMKYDGKVFDGESVIIESLVGNRLGLTTSKNELVVADNSAIIAYNKDISLEFTEDEIKNGIDGYQVSDYTKQLINMYGTDFEPDYTKVLDIENTKLLLECEDTSPYHVRPEYVGNYNYFRRGAYYQVRKQLQEYIVKNMNEEYKKYGGEEGCYNWFFDHIKKNLDTVILKLAYEYLRACEKAKDFSEEAYGETLESKWKSGFKLYNSDQDAQFIVCHNHYPSGELWVRSNNIVNTEVERGRYKCLLSDNYCSVFFSAKFNSIEALEKFIGKSVDAPRFLRLKKQEYLGNHLLDMVDPVSRVVGPLSSDFIRGGFYDGNKLDLRFALGLSKRSLNSILKMIKS